VNISNGEGKFFNHLLTLFNMSSFQLRITINYRKDYCMKAYQINPADRYALADFCVRPAIVQNKLFGHFWFVRLNDYFD